MDPLLVQQTRYVLRSRARRVQTCPDALFQSACVQFLSWLSENPVTNGLLQEIGQATSPDSEAIDRIVQEAPEVGRGGYSPGFYRASTAREHAVLCSNTVRAVAKTVDLPAHKADFVIRCLGEYITGNEVIQSDEAVSVIRDVAIDGLFEFLDERIDTRNVLFSILRKYKMRSEWFRKHRMREMATTGLEGATGERALAIDLQEYLLDQGVEFVIEGTSASGEADLALRQPDGGHLIVDAKYLGAGRTPSSITTTLAGGVHQVARYCADFDEPSGFLVVFNNTGRRISLELEHSDGARYLEIAGKLVYFMLVEISEEPSASRSGRASEVFVSRDQLLERASTDDPTSTSE